VTTLVVGFVTLTAFVLYGKFSVKVSLCMTLIALRFEEIFGQLSQPLVPISLLKNRGYNAAVCAALVGNMVYFSMRYVIHSSSINASGTLTQLLPILAFFGHS